MESRSHRVSELQSFLVRYRRTYIPNNPEIWIKGLQYQLTPYLKEGLDNNSGNRDQSKTSIHMGSQRNRDQGIACIQ